MKNKVYMLALIALIAASASAATANADVSVDSTGNITSSVEPTLSGINAVSSADGTAETISWLTDVNATAQVAYGTKTGGGMYSPRDSDLVGSHSIALSNLTPSTSYVYQIISTDESGNTTYSSTQTFTTASSDAISASTTTAPVISSIAAVPSNDGTNSLISWMTDQPSTTQLSYGTTSEAYSGSSTLDANLTTNHSALLTNLTPGIPYYFTINSGNEYGIIGSSAEQMLMTADATPAATTTSTSTESSALTTTTSINATYTIATSTAATSTVDTATSTSTDMASTTASSTITTEPVTPVVPPVTTSYPNMTLSPGTQTISRGQSIDFNGRNFPHEEDVNVYVNGEWLGKAHADGGGNFTTGSISMPNAAGTYTYTFVGATTGASMSSSVTVQ